MLLPAMLLSRMVLASADRSSAPGAAPELLDRVVAGDPAAVAEVGGWVRTAAAPFRSRLSEEWEDLQQSLMVELLEALRRGTYQSVGTPRAFVARVTAHTCIDRLRRRRRWRWEELGPAHEPKAPAPDLPTFLSLREIARRLPEHCRQLWRWIAQGWSYEEMSEELGLRPGTLRVRVTRCREQARELRAALEAQTGGGDHG